MRKRKFTLVVLTLSTAATIRNWLGSPVSPSAWLAADRADDRRLKGGRF